ncbi:DUF932 domain-containing protein [Uniformispora flossi]|uniref:DUF932 domain-containing protein n=1 Tax=Uniformispora flossi TaxID=3390723 RepID=UPI003C2C5181
MSAETLTWLSDNTLIGFTEKRGHAWHWREGDNNHYPGAVPVSVVHERLFAWTAVESPMYYEYDDEIRQAAGRKVIVRSDNAEALGVFKDGYQPHQYGEWLIDNVATLLDADLGIGSAGLLRGGAVAWVSVEVPDSITMPEGVVFRPNLVAATSFDGSVATTYKRVVTNVVCDNTLGASLREDGQEFRVRHSRNSMGRISDAREALAIVHEAADDFAAEVARLTATAVSDREFFDFVEQQFAPVPRDAKTSRGETIALNKQAALKRMWRDDERVAPWRGTAFGAWQAVNTYRQHEAPVRGGERAERSMMAAIDGRTQKADETALAALVAG